MDTLRKKCNQLVECILGFLIGCLFGFLITATLVGTIEIINKMFS